eukprot:6805971-Prymnesium_polylepis.1
MCCERAGHGRLRSSYNLSALGHHAANGLQLAFFRGVRSGIGGPRSDAHGFWRERAAVGDRALPQAAVRVYGAGLLSYSGARGDKVYSRAYDKGGGYCVGEARAAHFLHRTMGPKHKLSRIRSTEKVEWRRQRVKAELALHVLHALEVIQWI